MKEFLRHGEACHFAVSDLSGAGIAHTHDFHELFWVRGGEGVHIINGEERPLRPGMLVFIHCNDRHLLNAHAAKWLCISNLAFPVAHWRTLHERYWNGSGDLFEREPQRRCWQLAGVDWAQLQEAAGELNFGGRTVAALDRFLLNVAHAIESVERGSPDRNLPDWLAAALAAMTSARQLQKGVDALVEVAGRSPEHVSRTVRKHLGKTPTDVVNELRLELAARQLAQRSEPIGQIAEECGLPNVSHFYRLFRARFGKAPAEYRRQEQLIVSGKH